MKKILFALLLLSISSTYAQQNNFNKKLYDFCTDALSQTNTITTDRKVLLDNLAAEMANKRYLMFTCKTNSRRTLLLQAWTQAAFYYTGLYNKFALSTGDTVTEVYSEVANVLTASGFYCSRTENGNDKGYLISINDELPINIMLSKNYFGTIDTTHIAITNICAQNERSNIALTTKHFNLPYQSPAIYDKTEMEKQKYAELNKTIAIEMMYLAQKTKENMAKNVKPKK
jgi:hypothetical protein